MGCDNCHHTSHSRSTKRGQEPEYRAGGRKSCPPSDAHKVHSVLNRYKVVNTISKAFPLGELRNAPFMYIVITQPGSNKEPLGERAFWMA
jgi:hypothetical protein